MKLRKLRWYEWLRECFTIAPQWYALKKDGTLYQGWYTQKYAKEDAEKLGTNTIVWVPPPKKPPILKRTIDK